MKTEDIVIFTRQFATMIDAGLPLVQCLDILRRQAKNKDFGKILGQVKTSVEGGLTLRTRSRKHPKVFDDLFVNLVAAGEVGGILDTILNRLAVYIEKAMKLKRQVKGAMVYPISVLFIAFVVVAVLLIKVMPVFEKMFKDFGGGKLPAPTQFVIDISARHRPRCCRSSSASSWRSSSPSRRSCSTEKGRLTFDGMLAEAPGPGAGAAQGRGGPLHPHPRHPALLGRAHPGRAGHRGARPPATWWSSRASSTPRPDLRGQDLASPLMETELFPPMVVQMIAVGEQTGALDAMLTKIADFYEDEVDVAVASMTALIEPMMMVFLGTVIGGLLVAMYLPIFEMAGNIKAN